LKKNTAREVMKQFEKEMEKVDTIYENLVILDEL
jgi:Fe2+ or Zn2+ uptake regulation protein